MMQDYRDRHADQGGQKQRPQCLGLPVTVAFTHHHGRDLTARARFGVSHGVADRLLLCGAEEISCQFCL